MQRGTDFLGCDVAIMCGAMSWVSERNIVSAISNAGGLGVIACGAMSPELLDAEIAATVERILAGAPLGIFVEGYGIVVGQQHDIITVEGRIWTGDKTIMRGTGIFKIIPRRDGAPMREAAAAKAKG